VAGRPLVPENLTEIPYRPTQDRDRPFAPTRVVTTHLTDAALIQNETYLQRLFIIKYPLMIISEYSGHGWIHSSEI